MCFDQKSSFGFALFGLLVSMWIYTRTENVKLAGGVFFFFTMELLQGFQYFVIADNLHDKLCDSTINQVLTMLGFLHICMQPYFCHVINASLTRSERYLQQYAHAHAHTTTAAKLDQHHHVTHALHHHRDIPSAIPCRTIAAPLPHRCRTAAAPLPHHCRTAAAAPLPHRCRTAVIVMCGAAPHNPYPNPNPTRYKVVLRLSLIAGLWLFGRFVIAYTQHAASAVLIAPQPDPPQLYYPGLLGRTLLFCWSGLPSRHTHAEPEPEREPDPGPEPEPEPEPDDANQALRMVVEDHDGNQHDGRQAAWSKCPLWQYPSSAPTPPQGAPGSSRR